MLIDTVRETIRVHDLIHRGDHIVLGLSGGPDSVCLFHVLQRLAAEWDLTIHPVHVNHQLRPGDAERDQAYVERLCAMTAANDGVEAPAKAGVETAAAAGANAGRTVLGAAAGRVRPCRTFVVDCNALAKERKQTSEEAGRQARYDAFVQVARDIQATLSVDKTAAPGMRENTAAPGVRIAVAQNANDQAETILHRILRGTGPDGLAGIAYRRYEKEIPVIRPLLDVPRAEIETYCEENRLDPVIDHTNLEPIYMRNRIRLELLPELAQYNENIIDTLTRLSRIAAADRDFLWQQTEEAYRQLRLGDEAGTVSGAPITKAGTPAPAGSRIELDRAGLAELPEAIRRRVVLRAFREIGLASDISEERLRAADAIIGKKQAPKTVEFPRGYRLTVAKGRVAFLRAGKTV